MRLIQVEEIEQLLLQVPRIVELQEHQPAAFVARATIWLDLLEQALVAARAYQSARIAALRSQLIFARSAVARDTAAARSQPTRVGQLAFETAKAMSDATQIATAIVDEQRPRYAAAEARMREIVATARSIGVLPALSITSSVPHVADARHAIAGNEELDRQYRGVESGVGPEDAQLLLNRALGQAASARIPHCRQERADSAGRSG